MHKAILQILQMAILALAGVAVAVTHAEPPRQSAPRPEEVRADLPKELRDLNSSNYAARSRAARRLDGWVGLPELAEVLAEEFQRCVLQPELPMEVRWRLSLWRARLPENRVELPSAQSMAEIERLVSSLDADSYAVRAGASQRLKWLAGSEQFAAPILSALKQRLADPALSEDSYRRIDEVRRIAWGVWLTSDAGDRFLTPVTSVQIEQWLDDLARAGSGTDLHSSLRRRTARQNLMDAMARDADVPRVKAAVEARARGKLDRDASESLQELLELTRPAVVAECWSSRRQILEQHLVVGESKRFGDAAHPSYFDRADDREAHCASGNALTPGNYPIGVAFPAPHWPPGDKEAVFHLVNLPTPRRQVAYSFYVKSDPAARLAKLSRRTLDRFLAEKTLLSDPELGMLAQLDAIEVSRFAGRYFFLVDDGSVDEEIDSEYSTSRRHLGSESSRFGSICAQLAIDGTRDALPGLLDAIRQKRFVPPSQLAPYRLEWIAAFAIARRDPWPDVDTWLAESIESRVKLDIGHGDAAEIGATAAALLLERHHEKPVAFGLELVADPHILDLRVSGYSYAAAADIQRVRKWWTQQTEKTSASLSGGALSK